MSILDGKKIDLNLPVDAYDANGNLKGKPEGISEESSPEAPQAEEKEAVDEPEVDEQRVPYSRFDKIRREKEQYQQDAEDARLAYQELLRSQRPQQVSRESTPSSYEEEYTREIKRLYGNTPEAQEIIDINLRQQRRFEEQAERRAIEAVERVRTNETRALAENENTIESRLESLSDSLGKKLSQQEVDAVLSIVDEYTPTGPDGRYAGELTSFDKAWEVYELRQTKASLSTKKARSGALNAASARSQGEPTGIDAPENKGGAMSSRNWSSYFDRVGRI